MVPGVGLGKCFFWVCGFLVGFFFDSLELMRKIMPYHIKVLHCNILCEKYASYNALEDSRLIYHVQKAVDEDSLPCTCNVNSVFQVLTQKLLGQENLM
jgi:hypothetical protein